MSIIGEAPYFSTDYQGYTITVWDWEESRYYCYYAEYDNHQGDCQAAPGLYDIMDDAVGICRELIDHPEWR